MKSVAISKVKASLSQYLTMVKAGEEIVITDRGKPIAKLVPLKRDDLKMPPHLKELEHCGLIRFGTGKINDRFWEFPRLKDPKGLVLNALLAEREESR